MTLVAQFILRFYHYLIICFFNFQIFSEVYVLHILCLKFQVLPIKRFVGTALPRHNFNVNVNGKTQPRPQGQVTLEAENSFFGQLF